MSTFTDIVKSALPFISTALGGPFAGLATSFLADKIGIPNATVKTITDVLSGMSPEKLAEYRQADNDFQLKLASMGYDSIEKLEELNVRSIEAVNKTMQTEATSEHWASWFWRPFIGFTFGLYVSSLWVLPLFHVAPIMLPPEVTMAIGAILGVASWFKGKAMADVNNTAVTQG